MFLDACHDALRQIERGAACTAPCARLAACAYAVKELLQFGVEGLDRRRIQLFERELRLRPRFRPRSGAPGRALSAPESRFLARGCGLTVHFTVLVLFVLFGRFR